MAHIWLLTITTPGVEKDSIAGWSFVLYVIRQSHEILHYEDGIHHGLSLKLVEVITTPSDHGRLKIKMLFNNENTVTLKTQVFVWDGCRLPSGSIVRILVIGTI